VFCKCHDPRKGRRTLGYFLYVQIAFCINKNVSLCLNVISFFKLVDVLKKDTNTVVHVQCPQRK